MKFLSIKLAHLPICASSIIDWDTSRINFTRVGQYTMVEKDLVEWNGQDKVTNDKSQICTLTVTMSGEFFFQMQLIYGGKTDHCHPRSKLPQWF